MKKIDSITNKLNLNNPVFVFAICVVIFQLPVLSNLKNDIGDMVFLPLKFIAYIYILYEYFPYVKSKKISIITILAIAHESIIIISTVINGGMVSNVCRHGAEFVFICIFIDLMIKKHLENFFGAVLYFFEIAVFVNMLSVIFFPGGVYKTTYYSNNFLLGYDNQMINYILPAIILSLVNYTIYKNRKNLYRLVAILACSLLTELLVWSAMSLIIVSACVIYVLLSQTKFIKLTAINNIVTYMSVYALLWYGIVIAKVFEHFEFFITEILKKPMTLYQRPVIWEHGMDVIKDNLLIGSGKGIYAQRAVELGFKPNTVAGLHLHNRILELLYRGGIPLLLVFIFMLIYAGRKLWKFRKSMIAKVISFGIFIYMIGMITEYYENSFFFFGFLIMAENIEILIEAKNKNETVVSES